MKYQKQSIRVLFFVFLLACLLTGLAGIARVPARAAPPMQAATNIVISEFRTIGPNGGNDEFIEIYNPTGNSIPIGSWQLKALTNSGSEATRATILPGTNLGAGQHFLIAHTGYIGSVVPNLTYGTGIIDNGGIAIFDNLGNRIDSVG